MTLKFNVVAIIKITNPYLYYNILQETNDWPTVEQLTDALTPTEQAILNQFAFSKLQNAYYDISNHETILQVLNRNYDTYEIIEINVITKQVIYYEYINKNIKPLKTIKVCHISDIREVNIDDNDVS